MYTMSSNLFCRMTCKGISTLETSTNQAYNRINRKRVTTEHYELVDITVKSPTTTNTSATIGTTTTATATGDQYTIVSSDTLRQKANHPLPDPNHVRRLSLPPDSPPKTTTKGDDDDDGLVYEIIPRQTK